jgi:hypothetical protein
MPRHFKDYFEAAVHCNRRLPAVKARIEADIERACSRGDHARAHRYAGRLSMIERRYWTCSPTEGVSGYSDFARPA